MDMSQLVREIKKPSPGLRLRLGLVTAIGSDSTISVQIAGGTDVLPGIKYLDSMKPVVGTQVWLLNLGADILGIGKIAVSASAPTVASAATIAPTTERIFVSGAATINTITPPPFLAYLGGVLWLIPTGAFTTSITGNIALASTAVVGRALAMVYDPTVGKFYPSY